MRVRVDRLVAVVLLLVGGCSVLRPREDRTRYFVLTSEQGARGGAAPAAVVLGVDRIELPEYLVRPEIATRSETNQLQISDEDRWGEPLKDGFSRTLRDDLENQLGAGHVVAAPFDPAHRPPRILDVSVRRFERVLPDGVELEATWTLRDGASGAVLATEQAHLREAVAGNDSRATVAALSKALAALAAQVAAALRARS